LLGLTRAKQVYGKVYDRLYTNGWFCYDEW